MTYAPAVFADQGFQRAAEAALESAVTEQPRTVEPLGRGNRKRTELLRFDSRSPVVLQLCKEQTWLRTESVLLAQIGERTNVPVPSVLAADVTDGVAFMITAYVSGEDLHEQFTELGRERQRQISLTFGTYLGTLHDQFRFDGYGALAVDDGALTAHSGDWHEWLAEYGRTAVEKLPVEFAPIREELRAVFDEQSREQQPAARLFPWDFRPGNAVVAGGQVAAILDWEAPIAAAPALSVAKAEYLVARWYADDPAPLREAFIRGYERIREYPDVRPVHRVAAIADSAVDSTGAVTNPGYPELDREAAVAFHRESLAGVL